MVTLSSTSSQNSRHSISRYIDGLKHGDPSATRVVWERFMERLIALADRKLKGSPRKAMNEDDVVQQAFTEFFLQVQQGRFPKLDDRNDLWQILAMLVDRRAKDQIKRQTTQKAGGGRVRTESVFLVTEVSNGGDGIARIEDFLPTPALAAEFVELVESRLAELRNDQHRRIASYKMQGYTNREIANRLRSSERTIERSLQEIRSTWSKYNIRHESGSGLY